VEDESMNKAHWMVTVLVVGAIGVSAGRLGAQTTKSQWDGVYTAAQATRGEALYSQYCSACHGPGLTGGEMAPPLVGADFRANWNDLSVGDLFERIRTSMPQNNPGSLSRQQDADILAFMFSKDEVPAGQQDLDTQTEALNAIKFKATKP
jgi:mono/diheme cytochrome c family protein